ncbi:polysaccharide biosynthesis C-terminal domain-containing protein [Peribacillus frigoritolerans]|uniref:polysaccharide biosynthesis C-terminal domain-containing protein n=1 Tax=Peribacillus frigoritolerans TaxID=450367 RepID=UPI0038723626
MRSKKALANIIVSLLLQLTTIICGFIVPILIIKTYGSSVNGVIQTISQFLGYIVLLEAGVGGVVRAALYKPLAKKDIVLISTTLKATEKFFRLIGYVFIGYLIIVAIGLPVLVSGDFDKIFTFTLVLIIGISLFAEYFFGITYQLLLQADQRLFISSGLQIIITIINTIIVVVLIKFDANIHIVKLCSTLIFVLRPIFLHIYVKRKYKIIKDCQANNNTIKQKWDGLGHHLAYFLNNNSDIVVLILFTNVKEVSVYSVYMMVVTGVRNIVTTFSSGIEAAFGNMIAKGEEKALNRNFNIFEFFSFYITTVFFTSTALLIIPFISVYTSGITDVNYIRPLFAYIFVAAGAAYCIRLPYHSVVIAAGHFKQTRNGAFIEALINILLSVVLVNFYGLVGVAIGTLCAMLFRTLQYIYYLSTNILNRSIWKSIKRIIVNVFSVIANVILLKYLPTVDIDSYINWSIYAFQVTAVTAIVILVINYLFYYDDMKNLIEIVKRIVKRKSKSQGEERK